MDFICLEKKLIIEVDGGHHADGGQLAHDLVRDKWLEQRGYRILRYWNAEVMRSLDRIVSEIETMLLDPAY